MFLCAGCGDVRKIDLSSLENVPPWVRIIEEACSATGAEGIRVEDCDICRDKWEVRNSRTVLAELKESIEASEEDLR